ncbi:MAG: T9SS type A sorting domain-containing protein [Bacteroidetes bacterium]|nr:MAG: T9SS type A sorting domain-containing protein [Bacteroidota bacterium]
MPLDGIPARYSVPLRFHKFKLMRRLFTLIAMCSVVMAANAQSVFFEDFENGVNAQFTQQYIFGTLDWRNDPTGMTLGATPAVFEGDSTAHFYAGGNTEDRTSLISPTLDLSGGGYKLSFVHAQGNWLGDQNTLAIHISVDDGATWTLVDSIIDNLPNYTEAEYNLDDFAVTTSTSKIRFDGYSTWGYAIGLDVVNVFLPPVNDAEAVAGLSPVNGCGLGSEVVSIEIFNNGLDTIFSIDAGYQVGNVVETESFTDTILAGETYTLTFSVPLDMSTPGTYDITAWVDLNEDADAANDTVFFSAESIPVISALPYAEDFENGAGGWVSGGNLNPWQLGTPATAFITGANSGVNAWVTNLTGTYPNNTAAFVESPCFDFSSLQVDPVFRFAFIVNSEPNWDGTWVEVSTDAGATWATVGNVGEGTNWYTNNGFFSNIDQGWDEPLGNANQWFVATHLLDGAAGSSSVKVRVFFSSDGSVNAGYEGFAFDDIEIFEQPSINAGVTEIISPLTGCGLGVETVTVVIENFGDADLVDFAIEYDAGSGIVSELYTDTLFAASVDTFTFATTLDLSVTGDYDFGVWTAVVGDGDLLNDSLFSMITSSPVVTSLPYMEDFENGSGGWRSEGLQVAWELGDPEGNAIDTAYSGVNAWATNLNTLNYLNSEFTVLTSPCFDLSSFTADPFISFAIIYSTENNWDGAWVELSTDGGNSWSTVGSVGEGVNWYTSNNFFNSNIEQGWAGISGGGPSWIVAEHLLDGAAGSADARVRIVFSSDGSVNGFEGVAVDDVRIFAQPELDLSVVSFDGPGDNCSLDQESVTFSFWNRGLQTVSNFEVGFSVNASTPQYETYTGSVAHNDTVSFTFTIELADLSSPMVHSIDVFTALVGDEYTDSDTLFNNLVENFGASTPLSQSETPGLPISATIAEGTTSEIFFCGLPESLDGCLEIVSVSIDTITHTWLSDLDIYLISPAGDTIELSTDNGGSGENMFNVVFTDTATNDITLQTAGIIPGFYHPEDTLGFASLYNGQDPNGAWSLWVDDDLGGDDGILVRWSMTFRNNAPAPEIAYSDTTICLTQVLEVTTDEYDSYLWSTGNNAQTAQLFGNVLGLGEYEVYVTVDQDGCTGVSNSFVLTVDACAGIEELGGLTIEIYPNPSNGLLTLSIEGQADALDATVVDMSGKTVHAEQLGSIGSRVQKNLDLTGLANGVYMLRLQHGDDALVKRLIIQ